MIDSSTSQWIKIEVAYALPEKQVIKTIQVKKGTSVDEAIERCKIHREFEHSIDTRFVGVFSKSLCAEERKTYELKNKDRIEIYRPLIADPKQMRRQRQQKAQERKRRKMQENQKN